ncbi:TetR/AcrR family transcriptional regulator [Massilia violaceinigra]|uniref:TetR/AcrR family transcriptional regulator n=1 Tax=Massilia violaceinigra TaxID=2045208 RepID=A0ABY4ABU4_9BURK|nr:TetR/AcrR family transcriptional regulator [Massilia violaceinigra]UOD31867.1 TetR/AcrR family transcriptional regulator [Massilia violaceinigra]
MPSAKKSHPPLTRETILGAAIGLFQEHGFSGLGMRQIADCLQIKAPSLYHHFTSKEDLARQALQLYREGQATRLLAIEATGDVNEQLRMYAELFARMLDNGSRPCMYLMLVREPSLQEPACLDELRLFVKQNVDWLEGILRNCNDMLRLPTGVSARDLAETIFAAFEGAMAVSLVDPMPSVTFRERANKVLKLVITTT